MGDKGPDEERSRPCYCNFMVAFVRSGLPSAPIIPTAFEKTVALVAVTAIVATLSKLWPREYDVESLVDTPKPCICTETLSSNRRDATRNVKTRAPEALTTVLWPRHRGIARCCA